jgi:prepilin-type N-terminal cleavage/methylation domain-containing protein
MQRKTQHGFTLIELVVVIAILGILAGIAIPRFLDSQASARGAKIVADLRTIDSAAMHYYAQKGKYPAVINSATPATTDGFIGSNLAAWPKPATGSFIVAQLAGGTKTFTNTATYYTLTSEGRAQYVGHPVEYYLGGGDDYALKNSIGELINTELYADLRAALKRSGGVANSEDSYNRSAGAWLDATLKSSGLDLSNVSYSLIATGSNTYTLYTTDKKLTTADVGKAVTVTSYTGTITNGKFAWNNTSQTTKLTVVSAKDNGKTYPSLGV